MKNPKISVCKKGKGFSVGCFDGFECVRDFKSHPSEDKLVDEAYAFFEGNGISKDQVEIVRPRIDKMILKYG